MTIRFSIEEKRDSISLAEGNVVGFLFFFKMEFNEKMQKSEGAGGLKVTEAYIQKL